MSGEATNTGKKISSQITNGSISIPHKWLSRRDEIKFPHLRLRRVWGNFILSRLLSHSWGIKIEPFVIREEIFFPTFVASPLMWEKPIPISLQTGIGSIPMFSDIRKMMELPNSDVL